MGVSKNNGTPKSSILIRLSIINHPFWGTPIFGNTHIYIYTCFLFATILDRLILTKHLNKPGGSLGFLLGTRTPKTKPSGPESPVESSKVGRK